jgi:glucose/arabinose dehydrogenase
VAGALIVLAACGGSSPPTTPPPGTTGDTITGRERFGWTQSAPSAADLQTYRYAVYVDGQRRVIEGEACTPAAGGTSADCSAPLPPLTAGRHTLEVAAFFAWDDTIVEGARSPQLQVTVAAVMAPAAGEAAGSAAPAGGVLVSSDGLRLQADVLARDLADPIDIAATGDGRLLLAERGGVIRILEARGGARMSADNVLLALGEAPEPDRTELRAIAIDRDFARTGLVHAAYVTSTRETAVVRIARLRERRGLFGEAAVVASFPISDARESAVLRAGPDGMLYAAIGGSLDERAASNPGAPAGKVLRLRRDGTTPDDNPAASPAFSSGHHDPRGLAWLPGDGLTWELERAPHGGEINRLAPGANYGTSRGDEDGSPAAAHPALVLSADSLPSGMTAVHAAGSPFFGDLIVSTLGSEDLIRIGPDAAGQLRVRGYLLQRRLGRIGQVTAGPDGTLYFVTANRDEGGRDLLVRLTPGPRVR